MNAENLNSIFLKADEGQSFVVFGSTMTYKAMADDTGRAYSLAVETTPPHGGIHLHTHSHEDEAMFILEGEYEIRCGDRVIPAAAESFVFLPRGVPNSYTNITDSPARFIHITSPGGFEKLVEKTSRIKINGPEDMATVAQVSADHGIQFL